MIYGFVGWKIILTMSFLLIFTPCSYIKVDIKLDIIMSILWEFSIFLVVKTHVTMATTS